MKRGLEPAARLKLTHQKAGEPFLCEVLVVREYLAQPLSAQGHHRDAVGQAVALVRSGLVEPKAAKEALSTLRQDVYRTVHLHPLHQLGGRGTKIRPALAEVIEELREDLFGGDDSVIRQTLADADGDFVYLALGIAQGNSVAGVGEDGAHQSRLGAA